MNNGGPKNFKTMSFPPSRYGTPAICAPIVSQSKPIDPFKNYLNSLRCPVCGGQVDGVGTPYYCVYNREHYKICFVDWAPTSEVAYETVTLYDGHRKYQITQFDQGTTEIRIFEVDPENRIIEPKSDKRDSKIVFNDKLFDFSQTNREKMINRIRTILVFR